MRNELKQKAVALEAAQDALSASTTKISDSEIKVDELEASGSTKDSEVSRRGALLIFSETKTRRDSRTGPSFDSGR